MRSLIVLLGAALAVALGVMGLAALLLPDAPVAGSVGQQAAGEPDQPARRAPRSSPPTSVGGILEIAGDRPGSVELLETFSQDGRFQLGADNVTLLFGTDEGGAMFLDQASYVGLNFFLDPGDCAFDEGDHSLETGLVRLEMTCDGITDVNETATVTMTGVLDVPILVGLAGDRYASGGTMTLEGDMSAELPIPGAFWYPEPEECAGCMPQPDPAGSRTISASDNEGRTWSLEFKAGTDVPTLARLVIRPEGGGEVTSVLEPSEECAVTVSVLGKVAPDTELLEVATECPALTDGETAVSVSANARVYRVTTFFGR